jgi:hypothetical protein
MSLDLNKLSNKLDEALIKETTETLTKFLNDKRMTNNKQQTAVEILCGKLAMKLGIPQAITFYIDHQEEIREAKEMEKERIETAYNKGTVHGIDYPESTLPITGEQYYNETYGGGEQ